MNRRCIVCAMVLSMSAMTAVERAGAEMSPENVARMKRRATDVFRIEIVDVKVSDSKKVSRTTLIKAKIVLVTRSGDRVSPGELIEIDSYQIVLAKTADPGELLDALIGFKPPPRLKRGWKGTVYLKAKKSKGDVKRYGIAAFGHSFEPAPVSDAGN